jgi:hypothetical protein
MSWRGALIVGLITASLFVLMFYSGMYMHGD